MNLESVPVGTNPPHDVNVIIEVPIGGEPIKYELDKAAGILVVDRFSLYIHALSRQLWVHSTHSFVRRRSVRRSRR